MPLKLISTGEIDSAQAFMDELFKVDGNFNILMKMNFLFSKSETV